MALRFRGQRCPLCKEVLQSGDERVSFPHFLGPESDLWEYSDATMHTACFDRWPDRERFLRLLKHPEEGPPSADDETRARLLAERGLFRRSPPAPTAEENLVHNEQHARIIERVREHGASCPHCRSRSTSYRELNETARARLVCPACGRSCDAAELVL
jgi:hypothetical protein